MPEKLIRCRDCIYWKTGIAYVTTGRCTHENHYGLICNKNYFCADGTDTKVEACAIYDICEEYDNCTVQVLKNSVTGEVSVGWWQNEEEGECE